MWTPAPPLPDSISFAAYTSAQVTLSDAFISMPHSDLGVKDCHRIQLWQARMTPLNTAMQSTPRRCGWCLSADDHRLDRLKAALTCAGEYMCGEWLAAPVLRAAVCTVPQAVGPPCTHECAAPACCHGICREPPLHHSTPPYCLYQWCTAHKQRHRHRIVPCHHCCWSGCTADQGSLRQSAGGLSSGLAASMLVSECLQ